MVLSDITTNLSDLFVLKKEPKEEHKEEEHKEEEPKEESKVEEPKVEEPKVEEPKVEEPKVEEPKVEEPKEVEPKEEVYIILVNNKIYGHYYSENETAEQLDQAQEYVMSRHFFDFRKNYYWNSLQAYDDTIIKMKLVSVVKDNFVRYDSVEDSLEIVKSRLLPLHKE